MTIEELQAAMEAQQKQLDELTKENAQLKTNQSEQNSYITKLEAKLKEAPAAPVAPQGNKQFEAYIQKSMRRDVTEEAYAIIQQSVGKEVFDCLKPELEEFLKRNMTIERTTVDYVRDAFQLVYGKAMFDKNHAIHKIGTANGTAQTATPPAAATPGVTQNAQPAQGNPPVQQVSDKLRNFFAPSMTPQDTNAVQSPPTSNTGVKNTKDAMSRFKNSVLYGGGNQFS